MAKNLQWHGMWMQSKHQAKTRRQLKILWIHPKWTWKFHWSQTKAREKCTIIWQWCQIALTLEKSKLKWKNALSRWTRNNWSDNNSNQEFIWSWSQLHQDWQKEVRNVSHMDSWRFICLQEILIGHFVGHHISVHPSQITRQRFEEACLLANLFASSQTLMFDIGSNEIISCTMMSQHSI